MMGGGGGVAGGEKKTAERLFEKLQEMCPWH